MSTQQIIDCWQNGVEPYKATTFNWSSRNLVGQRWRTFYYCPGSGFDYGRSVYYGRNDWNTESDAIIAQQRWENRNPFTAQNQTGA